MGYLIRRTDATQKSVVAKFRSLGCLVGILSGVGHGMPDIVVGFPSGRLRLIEIKDGTQPPSGRKLSADEQRFHDKWHQFVNIVCSDDEAESLFNQMQS